MAFSPRSQSLYEKIFMIIEIIFVLCFSLRPSLCLFYRWEYEDLIEKYSALNNLSTSLVAAIINAESGFDKNAVSRKGAKGLMQIKPSTAAWCVESFNIGADPENLFSPEVNIEIGCRYLKYLSDKFSGNKRTVLAAYNAGEGNVRKWLEEQNGSLGEIPFDETQKYVKKVINQKKIYDFLKNTEE